MTFEFVLASTTMAVLVWVTIYKRSVCVVKIHDEYAVRRGVLFYEYKDLKSSTFWWSAGSPFFTDCLTKDLEMAKRMHDRLVNKGTVV